MSVVRGCELPEDVAYDVDMDVWVRRDGAEIVCGMTDVAQTRCGKLVTLHFKKVGRQVERGRSLCTVESAKWVGPFPAPVSGEVVATNEAALAADPLMVNTDPYGAGWLVRLQPTRWDDEKHHLLSGDAAVTAYVARIAELGVDCYRCADGSAEEEIPS